MQRFFLGILGWCARLLIIRHQPMIIGVTGTVGKTTITSHIAHYLRSEYGYESVRISPYHYNGEFGLPLSIIDAKTGGRNPFSWCGVFFSAFVGLFRSYPKYLVLEYGIDHPGEMEYLIHIARPDIVIISPIAPNHLEQFGTFESYRNAKLLLARASKTRIIHESLRAYMDMECLFYGMGGMSDIDASDGIVDIQGTSAQIHFHHQTFSLTLPSFGQFQIENILPVYGIASILGLPLDRIHTYASGFNPEPGRSAVLAGKNGSIIIDGSYNGGFESICRGIDSVLPFITSHPLIFFLGDMRELGESTEVIHKQLAQYFLSKIQPNHSIQVVLVGPLMEQYIAPILNKHGFQVMSTHSSREGGRYITSQLNHAPMPALIYVKGSQNTIFLEEGIKEFLAYPVRDKAKLCRQSRDWLKKKEIFFQSIPRK